LDYWQNKQPKTVISLWRAIKDAGEIIGFIEIQKDFNLIKKICTPSQQSAYRIIVYNDLGELVYPDDTHFKDAFLHYNNLVTHKAGTVYAVSPQAQLQEIVSYVHSDYSKWTVFAVQDYKSIMKPTSILVRIIIIINLTSIAFTVLVFYLLSNYLTKPLKLLRKAMETVTIDTASGSLAVDHQNDEIQALNIAFINMKKRLETAIKQDEQSRSLQLKAHFNALQAQINPHFLYNMLGVIANSVYEANPEDVAMICRSLAKMLRYSTSAKQKWATINEEINHASLFLFLMKKRFEDRLEYSIDIDKRILDIKMPKLVIQPLVENSISHGFNNSPGVMRISITGGISSNEWYIMISDNGSGFSQDVLDKLKDKVSQHLKALMTNQQTVDLSIGGMGLINTFSRLSLLYGGEFKFELKNNEQGGACVIIGGPIMYITDKEDDVSVQNNVGR